MSEKPQPYRSAQEQERDFLDLAEDLFEKSAAVVDETEFADIEESRFEDRPEVAPDDKDEDDKVVGASSRHVAWDRKPSIRNQLQDQPQTVRFLNPETKILNLSDPAELKEFNRIQKEAADHEAPTLGITEVERQQYEGKWTVLITFCEVHYMQL